MISNKFQQWSLLVGIKVLKLAEVVQLLMTLGKNMGQTSGDLLELVIDPKAILKEVLITDRANSPKISSQSLQIFNYHLRCLKKNLCASMQMWTVKHFFTTQIRSSKAKIACSIILCLKSMEWNKVCKILQEKLNQSLMLREMLDKNWKALSNSIRIRHFSQ